MSGYNVSGTLTFSTSNTGTTLKYDSNFDHSAKSTATVLLALFRGRFVVESLSRNDQATAIVRL